MAHEMSKLVDVALEPGETHALVLVQVQVLVQWKDPSSDQATAW